MTFTVLDTTDASGTSLRAAITSSNANNPGPGQFNTINFNISAGGSIQTINLLSALPAIIQPVLINGYSEPGASVNTQANSDNANILIELNGANAGSNADGILLSTGSTGSTIKGLAINRFTSNGIEVQSGNNVIAGNFVGTNPAGTAAQPNQSDGILINSSLNNVIGGLTPDARNIVSGNGMDGIHIVGTLAAPASGNTIAGNFVGVNAAGTGSVGTKTSGPAAGSPAGNFFFGIEISGGNGNTVGGNTAAARNVVGLNVAGIELNNGSQNNVIAGNYSGVGADGITPVGNNLHGIVIRSSDNLPPPLGPGQANEPATANNIIGLNPTTFAGLGNLVEFNGTAGVAIFGNPGQNNSAQAQNSGNSILGNSIFENGRSNPTFEIGIDLSTLFPFPKDDGVTPNDSQGHGAANDPNNFQNFPVLTSVTAVSGGFQIAGSLTQSVSPNTTYRIEFFANNPDPLGGIPEGQTFIGAITVTTNASGTVSFTPTFNVSLQPGQIITADATNLTPDPSAPAGSVNVFNTSEFSAGIPVTNTVPANRFFAVGADAGGAPEVVVYNATTGAVVSTFYAFSPGFTGGVRVAVDDVNGDGTPDIIAAAGPGGGPQVEVIDGTKLTQLQSNGQIANTALLNSFFAFNPSFTGGVFVAAATTSTQNWVAVDAGPGGGPQVVVYTKGALNAAPVGTTPTALVSFFAFTPSFTGGVSVALGDVNGDGKLDIIVGAGPGGGPQVSVVDGTKLSQIQSNGTFPTSALLANFYAFNPSFTGGVFVSGGATTGGPFSLIIGAGPIPIPPLPLYHPTGGGPQVLVLNGALLGQLQSNGQIASGSVLASFFALPGSFTGGVRVGFNGAYGSSGKPAILTAAGPSGGPQVAPFDGATFQALSNFFALPSGFTGGLFIAG